MGSRIPLIYTLEYFVFHSYYIGLAQAKFQVLGACMLNEQSLLIVFCFALYSSSTTHHLKEVRTLTVRNGALAVMVLRFWNGVILGIVEKSLPIVL